MNKVGLVKCELTGGRMKNGKMKSLIGMLAIGAAAGYVASLFVSPEIRRKHKRALKDAGNKLPSPDVDKMSQAVFGSKAEEMKERTQELIDDFGDKLASIKGAFESIDEKKYKRTVDSFAKALERDKSFTRGQITKVKRYLKDDYRLVKKAARS